ncbi:hypothetical protein [Thalassobaculum sp.]|uniref:hypothetical protein n=1 Tax=Thalassobaculum sp. TaxID=2022740 RepID=UPI0032EF2782
MTESVVKHHRTIGTTLSLLIRVDFQSLHVQQFCPAAERIEVGPELLEKLERPMFQMVAARIAGT